MNCQRIGHGSSNCRLAYRCVKCAQSHGPGKCEVPANSPKELLKCANCNEIGHTASFRSCPYLMTAINNSKKINQPQKRKQKKQGIIL